MNHSFSSRRSRVPYVQSPGRPWRWRTLPKLVPGRKANRFTFVTLAHDLAVVVIVAHDALLSLYANLQGLLQNRSRDPLKNVLRHSVQKRLWLSSSGCSVLRLWCGRRCPRHDYRQSNA